MEDDIEADFLGFFETFLLVFAGIALLVATFSIYNTFSILVAQRTRESALLRALGGVAPPGPAVGGRRGVGRRRSWRPPAGIAVGLGLASGLLALMSAMGMSMPASSLVLAGSTIVTAVAVGVIVTLVASLAPAVRAARTAPLAAIRDVAVDTSASSRLRAVGAACSSPAPASPWSRSGPWTRRSGRPASVRWSRSSASSCSARSWLGPRRGCSALRWPPGGG